MNKVMRFASMLLLFVSWNMSAAQGIPDPPPPDPSGPPIGPGLPIDDNIILLFLVALVYGIYKTIQIIKKRQEFKS